MTAVADPALGFWLRHVAADGGLSEPDGDATYVVLPPPLRDAYRLPEELRVTADPDVAREDGAMLLTAGHPVLIEAAERVLASGDTGRSDATHYAGSWRPAEVRAVRARRVLASRHATRGPVPPQAKRRVVPPQVRKQHQKATATLAERIWRAVSAGDRRTLARLLHPGSPAEALNRLLGPPGLCRVLGMPPGEEPERFVADARGDIVTGALLGSDGTECDYHIWCRDGQAAEVLPFPPGRDGVFWPYYWWDSRPGARWTTGRIVPAAGLDPVEVPLAVSGTRFNGLPVAARALAAWGRISAVREQLPAAHAPGALAAAVNRLVACRAGGRITFAQAAAQFRVPEQDVRRADRSVRPPLALGPGQPW